MLQVERFHQLPDPVRMLVRGMVERAGGTIAGYSEGLQVCLPREGKADLIHAMRLAGFGIKPGSRFWFPACNNEPESCWHWKRESDHGNRSAAYVSCATFVVELA